MVNNTSLDQLKSFLNNLLVHKVKEQLQTFTEDETRQMYDYDLLYINDQAHIEGYQPIEEVFKNKMIS